MGADRLTRRAVLRTAALATTTLAAPFARGACLDEPEHIAVFDEPENCVGIQNPLIPAGLIQSDFHSGGHGNFEAVTPLSAPGGTMDLWHSWHDNSNVSSAWHQGQRIAMNFAGAGSIIQSDFRSGVHGNFEVVVPLFGVGGAIELWHFFHDNSDVNKPWQRGQRIATNVAGAACIIQSDFRRGSHGNFEVVVPLVVANGKMDLWHFWHDNSDVNLPWRSGQRIAENVAGPGCIIQSDFKSGTHGNFEVVVPLLSIDRTMELWHFWRDNSDVNKPWQRGQRISSDVSGSGVIIQSNFRSGSHGNFEVVVPIGNSLVHFWHDNFDVNKPWQRGENITDVARGPGCIIQSDFIGTDVPKRDSDCTNQYQSDTVDNIHGNFEVLVPESSQSLVHYWHPNQDVTLPWLRRLVVVVPEPPPSKAAGATKIVQLTGEYDRQGWDGQGTPSFAFNRTECRFGLRGTDLGASFEHNNRLYFLFGDTWRIGQTDAQRDLDSIAFTTDTDPSRGVHLTFNSQPPLVRPCINQHSFNVPVDGTSSNGAMYVFFTTDSYQVDNTTLMGRSVLGRSTDGGYNFAYLGEFSRSRFVNVSVEQGTVHDRAALMLGLRAGTPVLWIWGTGRYRMSSVYLAVLPLANLDSLTDIRYFAGDDRWSSEEREAAALVREGDIGELSVRWSPFLRRWLLLFNSLNPRGILMHSARHPWGPWSIEPVLVFDPFQSGYGKFMHAPGSNGIQYDHVQDNMFLPPPPPTVTNNDVHWMGCGQLPWNMVPNFPYRDDTPGGEYGPYQIPRYAGIGPGNTPQIWFTMSTWNPYQAMLMTALIPSDFV
jgi:hypothetical protein